MKPEEHILEIVSEHTRVPIFEMKGRTRRMEVVEAKQIFFYLCRNLLPLSYSVLGKMLNMDHSTVIYSIKAINDKVAIYPAERENIEDLMGIVKEKIEYFKHYIDIDSEIFMESDCYKN